MNTKAFRQQFALNEDIYLLNHSVGKMPISTQTILNQQYLDPWQTSSGDPWPQWLEVIDHFRGSLAALFNADADDFCPQTNISGGLTKLLGALPKRRGKDVLLYTENDFPSTGFVIQKAQALGYHLRCMPSELNPQDINVWSDNLTDDVAAVLIGHVHYNTSRRIPVEEITRLCRQREIFSIVDIAQSAGIVPIDFKKWRADAILGSCVKWLCGGPGAAFLWIENSVAESLNPIDVGWFSHQSPFEFDIHRFEYHRGALRFWGGTPSVLPYCIAANSINTINDIGVDSISAHNQELTHYLVENLGSHRLSTPAEKKLRGGTLVIKLVNDRENSIQQRLAKNCVRFDSRALGIRLSPHIYNSMEEIQQVSEYLA